MNEYLISSLEQQLKQDPTSRVFFRLAEEFRKGGAYDRALEVCRAGIAHHPNYVPALVCMGRCLLQLGLRAEAEQNFRQVLAKTPDNPHALSGLATICREGGRLDEALAYYETLAIQEPNTESVAEEIEKLRQAHLEANPLDPPTAPPPLPRAFQPPPPAESQQEPESLAVSDEVEMEEIEALDVDDIKEELDPIDLEFERALQEPTPEEELLPDITAVARSHALPAAADTAFSEEDERMLAKGLRHEKKNHYEASFRIYQNLLKKHPDNEAVLGHLTRVKDSLKGETKPNKKIRILSNWLDKIKGVYYVP